jgi:outer membrane protein assembly factor BamB
MIRIRPGSAWRHDPQLAAALRRDGPRARAVAAQGVVDALAFDVDGVDITAGRAEGALLPSLEAVLRAVARVTAGAPHATVAFPDGALELLIRRRGASALLSVVSVSRPSRVLAQDVEVELEALAGAALEAAADLCRELAELAPGTADGARGLRAAARDLRRTEPRAPAGPRALPPPRRATAGAAAGVSCTVELADEEGVLATYEGGRPDLGALLAPGTVRLAALAEPLLVLGGFPFLVLRDLAALAGAVVSALQRGDRTASAPLPHGGRGPAATAELDLGTGVLRVGGRSAPVQPLALVRALCEAALAFGRLTRARNPRQAENGYLVELEAAAAERLGQADELAGGDVAVDELAAPVRVPALPRVAQEPLGPGRLRRVAFRRVLALEVGRPAGGAAFAAAGRAWLAAGDAAVVALDARAASVAWRAPGCVFAAALPAAVLAVRDGKLHAHALRGGGRTLWSRALPGEEPPTGAAALSRGPWLLVEAGAVTGLDPGTGRTVFRFTPPGARRLWATAFGGIAAVAADTGFLYGVDAAGRVAWRVRAPAPLLGPPVAAGACVAVADAPTGAVLLAVDPASGVRCWEAPLELAAAGAPVPWAGGLAVGGTVGGDPAVALVRRSGEVAWTSGPGLAGAPVLAGAGPLLAVRDGAGALAAFDRGGAIRWSRPGAPGNPAPSPAAPVRVRGALLVPGEGIRCLDAATGELLGAATGVAPAHLVVDASLALAAMDADGVVTVLRLATHLSVV